MPTILLINGFRFFFYAGDGNEYVHVDKGDGAAKIWLEPMLDPQYFDGFKAQEKKEIMKLTTENYETLKSKWYEFFR